MSRVVRPVAVVVVDVEILRWRRWLARRLLECWENESERGVVATV